MKIFLISNMFPSTKDPLFGVFVKNFKDELEKNNVLFQPISLIKGLAGNPIKKVFNYSIHYFNILIGIFKKFDLVYVHYVSHHIPILFLLLPFKRKPWVMNAHGTDIIDLQKNKYLNIFAEKVLKKTDLLVVPTSYFKSKVLQRYSFLEEQDVFVSPSGGIDSTKFFIKEKDADISKLHLGFVSRFIEEKGWKTFLDALLRLKEKRVPFVASIAGKGPDEQKILSTIKQYGLEEDVQFLGLIPQDKLVDIYNGIDLYVFPTYREAESLGLTGLEAMACGTPVIACNIAGPATYIQSHKNGFLFEPKNSEALTDYIIQYQRLQPEQKDKFKLKALNTSKNFRKDIVAQNLLKHLTEVMRKQD
jgi:glycosyltransferase involved in cell wall biosynthesis